MKFSENFQKFNGDMPSRGFVLLVFGPVERCELSKFFTDWDTLYIRNGQREHYQIGPEPQILILFVDDENRLHSTVRKFDKDKYDYYKAQEGKWVEVCRA